MKLGSLKDAYQALLVLGNQSMKASAAFRINENLRLIKPIVDNLTQREKELISQHNGVLQDGGYYQIPECNVVQFSNDYAELLNTDVEFIPIKVKFIHIEDLILSPSQLSWLKEFYEL